MMLVSLAALMVMSSILRWILQAFSNGQIPFLIAVFTPAIFKSASMGGLSYKSMQFFMVACFFKFVNFSPNVCMLVVLVVKFGRRNVLASRKNSK